MNVDDLTALILAEAARLRDLPANASRTPCGWTDDLVNVARRLDFFTLDDDPAQQARNLAEIRATAIHAAALACVVARLADEGRRA